MALSWVRGQLKTGVEIVREGFALSPLEGNLVPVKSAVGVREAKGSSNRPFGPICRNIF
jgi:hypothetical protein